jgi:hypothetical protein
MSQTLLIPIHEQQLQTIIQAVTFETVNFSANIGYANSGLTDPYCFITAGEVKPNLENGNTFDSNTYYRAYEYDITFVFSYATDGNPNNAQEARINTVTELILNTLQSNSVRNNSNWNDLIVTSVTPAFNPDPSFKDNLLYKTFSVEIRNFISISTLP